MRTLCTVQCTHSHPVGYNKWDCSLLNICSWNEEYIEKDKDESVHPHLLHTVYTHTTRTRLQYINILFNYTTCSPTCGIHGIQGYRVYEEYWIHGDTGIQGVSGVLDIHLSEMYCVARGCLWYEKTRQIRIGFEFLPCHVNYCRKVGTN